MGKWIIDMLKRFGVVYFLFFAIRGCCEVAVGLRDFNQYANKAYMGGKILGNVAGTIFFVVIVIALLRSLHKHHKDNNDDYKKEKLNL